MFVFPGNHVPPQRRYTFDQARIAELDQSNRLKELHIYDKIIPFIPFKEINTYLSNGYQYTIEKDLDAFTDNTNRIISLKNEKDLKLVEVEGNENTNTIYPPH